MINSSPDLDRLPPFPSRIIVFSVEIFLFKINALDYGIGRMCVRLISDERKRC